jgi:hypothetical protein
MELANLGSFTAYPQRTTAPGATFAPSVLHPHREPLRFGPCQSALINATIVAWKQPNKRSF